MSLYSWAYVKFTNNPGTVVLLSIFALVFVVALSKDLFKEDKPQSQPASIPAGLTREQVISRQGPPDSKDVRGRQHETWTYGDLGVDGTVIFFDRKTGRTVDQREVIDELIFDTTSDSVLPRHEG